MWGEPGNHVDEATTEEEHVEQLTERYEHLRRATAQSAVLGGLGSAGGGEGHADDRVRRLGLALSRERSRREAAEHGLDALAERIAALEAENARLRRV